MSHIFDHPLFANLKQKGLETQIYAQAFHGAQIEIMGASPYLNARDAGIELCLSKKHQVEAIHLYNGTLEGFCRFQNDLPGGATFDWSRAQIQSTLGPPSLSMDAGGAGIMAIEHAFDRYENDRYYIRFQYEKGDNAIRLVTLGLA
jgi:hypothetical protein